MSSTSDGIDSDALKRAKVAEREKARVEKQATESRIAEARDQYKRAYASQIAETEKRRVEEEQMKEAQRIAAKRELRVSSATAGYNINTKALNKNKNYIHFFCSKKSTGEISNEEKKLAYMRSQAAQRDLENAALMKQQALKEANKLVKINK